MSKLISIDETGYIQSVSVMPSTDVDLFRSANSTVTYLEVDESTSMNVGDHYNEETGVVTAVAPTQTQQPVTLTKVSPVEFKLLFTIQERLSMRTAQSTDPVIEDFFDLIDDPRLLYVDLSIPPVIEMVNYLETKGLIDQGRATLILNSPGNF